MGGVIVYELRYSNRFTQQFKTIMRSQGRKFRDHLVSHIKELANDPINARPGCDIKKMEGRDNFFRLRIGDLRVVYEIDPDEHVVYLVQIFSRGRGYR